MELITIEKRIGSIIVHDGKLPKARLKWSAPGLEIYLLGPVPTAARDNVQFHAMSACLARHIPLIALKSHGWV